MDLVTGQAIRRGEPAGGTIAEFEKRVQQLLSQIRLRPALDSVL